MAVEKLEIETFFGKCKCCFNFGYLRSMWEQHAVGEEIESYGMMLTQCFSIEWIVNTSIKDDQICEECIWKLQEAYAFKEQVLQCQKQMELPEDAEEVNLEPQNEIFDVEYLDEDILDKSDKESEKECDIIVSRSDIVNEAKIKNADEGLDNDEDHTFLVEDDDNSALGMRTSRKRRLRRDENSGTEQHKSKWPKKLPAEEQRMTYKQYSEDAMKDALEAVINKKMSQKQAAKNYKVPRNTLGAKVQAFKSDTSGRITPRSEIDNITLLSKYRENIHSVLAYSNATPIRGHWGVGYACAFCPTHFKDAAALKIHTQTHAPTSEKYKVKDVRSHVVKLDVTDLKCQICNVGFEQLENLMHHLKINHNKPMNFDIKNHLVPYKFENEKLRCVKCMKYFNNFKNISEHMNDSHFRNYECEKCGRGFVNKTSLITHNTKHRTGEFSCTYCEKIFKTRYRKTEHERIFHIRNNKTRKCGYCNEKFADVAKKIDHEVTTHGAQRPEFKCNACDKSFASQKTLKSHIMNVHLLYRPYKCCEEGCEKSFFVKIELQAHMLTHSDERPFSCAICPRMYKSKKSLNTHKHYHNETRQFQCRMCKKRFMNEDNLNLHLKHIHDIF